MFAYVPDAAILGVTYTLPPAARRLSDGAWLCPPDGQWTTTQAETCGWYQVVDVPRPDDTPTTTHDLTVQLVDGTPTVVWVERPMTPDETTDYAADSNRQTVITAVRDAMDTLALVINDMTTYRDLPNPTSGQALAQVSDLCQAVTVMARNQRRLIRLAATDLLEQGDD